MQEEGGVGEFLEARSVVGHHVIISWEESCKVAIAVGALVVAGVVAEVCSWPVAGHGPFVDAGDSGGVVRSVGHGGVPHVVVMGNEGSLGQQGSLLQVAVGDASMGVVGRHELGLDGFREGEPPDAALACGVVENPAHAGFCGIGGANEGWVLRHDLS